MVWYSVQVFFFEPPHRFREKPVYRSSRAHPSAALFLYLTCCLTTLSVSEGADPSPSKPGPNNTTAATAPSAPAVDGEAASADPAAQLGPQTASPEGDSEGASEGAPEGYAPSVSAPLRDAAARWHTLSGRRLVHWPATAITPPSARTEQATTAPDGLSAEGEQAPPGLAPDLAASDDAGVRLAAVSALREQRTGPAARDLVVLVGDPDAVVSRAAVRALAEYPVELLQPWVWQALARGTPELASAVANALPAWRDALEAPLLARLDNAGRPLGDRQLAAYALGRLGSERAATRLAQLVRDAEWPLAYVAADALSRVRSTEAVALWRGLLNHAAPAIREMALESLTQLDSANVGDTLYAAAAGRTEPAFGVQYRAAELLYDLELRDAATRLVRVMAENPPLRVRSSQLLQSLTGYRYGARAQPWQDWLARAQAGEVPWRAEPEGEGPVRPQAAQRAGAEPEDEQEGGIGWLRRLLGRFF